MQSTKPSDDSSVVSPSILPNGKCNCPYHRRQYKRMSRNSRRTMSYGNSTMTLFKNELRLDCKLTKFIYDNFSTEFESLAK